MGRPSRFAGFFAILIRSENPLRSFFETARNNFICASGGDTVVAEWGARLSNSKGWFRRHMRQLDAGGTDSEQKYASICAQTILGASEVEIIRARPRRS